MTFAYHCPARIDFSIYGPNGYRFFCHGEPKMVVMCDLACASHRSKETAKCFSLLNASFTRFFSSARYNFFCVHNYYYHRFKIEKGVRFDPSNSVCCFISAVGTFEALLLLCLQLAKRALFFHRCSFWQQIIVCFSEPRLVSGKW